MTYENANPACVPDEPQKIASGSAGADSLLPPTVLDWPTVILNRLDDALFSLDRTWRFAYLNPQASVVFGQPPEALLGKVIWEVVPALIGTDCETLYRQAMAEGTPGHLDDFSTTMQTWYAVRVDPIAQGLIVSLHEIAAPQRADAELQHQVNQGQAAVPRALADVTHDDPMHAHAPGRPSTPEDQTFDVRTREETALQSSDTRFRALIDHSPDAIALFHLDGTIVYGSPATTRILGYPLDEFVGQNGFALIHPDDRRMIADRLATILDDPTISVPMFVRIRHQDGSWRVLEGTFTNLLDMPSVGAIINNYRDITERVQTEAALRSSEARFRHVFAANPSPELITRADTRTILDANPAFATMTGYTLAELIGQTTDALGLWPQTPLNTVARTQLEETDRLTDREIQLQMRDGRVRELLLSVVPLTLDGVACYLTVMLDQTDRKRAEAALRQSEQRFATAFRANPAAMSITHIADGSFTDINASHERLFGYTREELIGQTADAIGIYANPDQRAAIVDIVRAHGSLHEVELTLRTKAGDFREVLCSLEVLELDGDASMLGCVFDITDRKQAEALLRYQADLLAHISDAIISVDADFIIKSWNAAAERLYGWPAHDVIGRSMVEILPTTYLDSDMQQSYATLIAHGRWQGEVVHPHRDGTTRTILSSVSLLHDRAGTMTGAVGINRDITDRKLAEQALARATNRLQVLADASRTFAEVRTSYHGVLDEIARTIVRALGDSCTINLLSDDGQWLASAIQYDLDPAKQEVLRVLLADTPLHVDTPSLITHIFHGSQPLLVSVVDQAQVRAASSPQRWALAETLGIHSRIGVPMRTQGRTIGVLLLFRHRPELPAFDADDLTLAQDLADRAAMAISNAQCSRDIEAELERRLVAEHALQASQDRLASIVGSAMDAIISIDADQRIVVFNPAAEQMFGCTAAEALGQSLDPFIPMPFRRAHAADIHAFGETGITSRSTRSLDTLTALRADGTPFPIEATISHALVAGQPLYTVIMRDISIRVHTETALIESEGLLRAVTNTAQVGLVIIDSEHRYRYANPAYASIFHLPTPNLVGQRVADVLAPVYEEQIRPRLERAFAGERVNYELVIPPTAQDTRPRSYVVTYEPGVYQSGTVVVVVVVEITERKRFEAQFLQSQKMEGMGKLAGGIAHDFNNLLTVILGYCDLLVSGIPETHPLAADLREIQGAGNRAAMLVRQILAFSRQQVLTPQVVNLNATMTNMDTLLQRVIGADIDLVSLLDPHLATVLVDPGQIEQVIMNLAVNARDAMPDGGQLTIETATVELDEHYRSAGHPELQTGMYVMLAVSDTGMGMDAATQAQIFEPFYTTKAPGKGTGLGLATVYGIVRQSAGFIWVYSEPGVGTTLKIYLPIATDDSQTPAPSLSDTLQSAALPAHIRTTHSCTILVVEDDDAVRDFIHRVLIQAGYTILQAHNGYEALDLLSRSGDQVDLVLTDIVMPQMGGRTLVERLHGEWAQLKVLCMSGYTDHAVQRHQIVQPCATFLQKPFTPTTLLRRIADVLNDTGDPSSS